MVLSSLNPTAPSFKVRKIWGEVWSFLVNIYWEGEGNNDIFSKND